MKKIGKILFVCLLAVVMAFFAFACGNETDNKDPDTETGDKDTTLTIHDAYENTRPDYEGDFGYETGYEPIVPPPPDKEITLTLDESSPINFADGTKTMSININSALTAEDFDLSEIDEGEELGGVVMKQEDGTYGAASDLASFSIPWEDATIKPYFTPADYEYLRLEARINTDGIPTSPMRSPSLVTGTIVGGSKYAHKGIDIVTQGVTNIGSALRFDAPSPYTSISNGLVYEYACNFENRSEYPLHLDGYIISASSEYKNGSTAYESRYRMDIDLEPGESVTLNPQYHCLNKINSDGTGGNMLVYFVADRTMKDVNFGAAFYVKERADLEEPSISTEPEAAATAEIKFELPEGVTVEESYETTVTAGETLAAPTAEQVNNTTGRTIGGWYYENMFGMTFIGSDTVAPDGELTMSPYFAPETGTALVLGSGASNNMPDFFGALADIIPDDLMESPDYGDYSEVFSNDNAIIENERGTLLKKTGKILKDDIFRFKTSMSIQTGHKYKYTFIFDNHGEEDVSFELYQIQGQLLYNDGTAVSKQVTVKGGESETVTIEITMNGNNGNSLTLFRMTEESEGFELGVRMRYEDFGVEESVTNTLTLGGNGVEFVAGGKTAEVALGDPLPEVKVSDGVNRTLLGYYTVSGSGARTEVDADSFAMPANALTIYPYFDSASGFTAPNIGSGANNKYNTDGLDGKDGVQTSSFYVGNTVNITEGVLVEGGDNGYTEKGIGVSVANNITAGSGLRFDTKYSVTGGSDYTFRYNFENKGTSEISLKVYQINASSEYKNGNMNMATTDRTPGVIELAAGESMELEITFSHANNNGNVMTYFVAADDMSGMNLAFSMSVKKA